MRTRNYLISVRRTSLSFGLLLLISLTACSTNNQFEKRSASWNLIVREVHQPVKKEVFNPKSDLLSITIDLTYIGPHGDLEPPVVSLTDEAEHSIKLIDITRVVENQAGENSPQHLDEAFEILNWFQQKSEKKKRILTTGERFTLTYIFENLKEHRELRLKVGDIPPVLLSF